MSMTYSLNLTISYIDATTRTYKLPTVNLQQSSTVKPLIQAFNAAAADSTSDIAKTFISENGMAPVGITEAQIITVEEEVLYSG